LTIVDDVPGEIVTSGMRLFGRPNPPMIRLILNLIGDVKVFRNPQRSPYSRDSRDHHPLFAMVFLEIDTAPSSDKGEI
jgi:hypothetical protein